MLEAFELAFSEDLCSFSVKEKWENVRATRSKWRKVAKSFVPQDAPGTLSSYCDTHLAYCTLQRHCHALCSRNLLMKWELFLLPSSFCSQLRLAIGVVAPERCKQRDYSLLLEIVMSKRLELS